MTRISIDTPCYFITSVTHDRLPIFRTDKLKEIVCNALNEARKSADLLYFAYAIMSDHFHIITDGKRSFMQKVEYIHNNPVKDGLTEHPEDYLYSSARIWQRRPLEAEPLEMNLDQIEWRQR